MTCRPTRSNALSVIKRSSENIGTKSAFGSVQIPRSAPTSSVLQLQPRTNSDEAPVLLSAISQ